jgi:hypothetical protein
MAYHPDTIVHSDWFSKKYGYIQGLPEPCLIVTDKHDIFSETLPNIYIQVEPEAVIPNEKYLLENSNRYHTIYTFNQNVLLACPNAKKYVYGTTWVDPSDYNAMTPSQKMYKISTLTGAKAFAPGHFYRQKIHHHQEALKEFPITFFRSNIQQPYITDYGNNPLLVGNKVELFGTFQFSMIIENSKQANYFTEKLIDCILTRTIPIYWGCPNISEFFDTTGWIILDTTTIEELITKLKQLTPEYYEKYYDIVEKNFNTAHKYTDFCINLNNAYYLS